MKTTIILAALLGIVHPAAAGAGATCQRWSNEKEGVRCLDCIRRVWDGHRWREVNTCPPEGYFNLFEQGL